MMRSAEAELRQLDRKLGKLAGLMNDPQAKTLADSLLDRRLVLTAQLSQGFTTYDRRRVTGS